MVSEQDFTQLWSPAAAVDAPDEENSLPRAYRRNRRGHVPGGGDRPGRFPRGAAPTAWLARSTRLEALRGSRRPARDYRDSRRRGGPGHGEPGRGAEAFGDPIIDPVRPGLLGAGSGGRSGGVRADRPRGSQDSRPFAGRGPFSRG